MADWIGPEMRLDRAPRTRNYQQGWRQLCCPRGFYDLRSMSFAGEGTEEKLGEDHMINTAAVGRRRVSDRAAAGPWPRPQSEPAIFSSLLFRTLKRVRTRIPDPCAETLSVIVGRAKENPSPSLFPPRRCALGTIQAWS